ncbi:MAG TPA: hypothetical protein VMB03_25865 [Bryobacteraceae bacterium]|nr:hypothetical protein [Bryobacteraceae bacterium]
MIRFTRLSLFLGVAASLMAATNPTLSFGEISSIPPANAPTGACPLTTKPCYSIALTLSTANTAYAGATGANALAGFQFDVNYDPNSLNVVVGLGANTTGLQVNTTTLPAANNPSSTAPANAGPGQRAIIIGCCSGSQQTPTSSAIADGAVATLFVQATASASAFTLTFPSTTNYMAATSQGGNNIAATAIPLGVGAGSSDPNGTGVLDISTVYEVGGVYPSPSDTSGFGSGSLALNDLVNVLFALNSVTTATYTIPACGSNRWDAMNTFPQDTAILRGGVAGGEKTLTLNDLVTELFMLNSVTGYTTRPWRIPAPYNCANLRTTSMGPSGHRVVAPPETMATLIAGANQGAGTGQDRVPIYLESRVDLSHFGLSFGLGDRQSRLQFQAAAGVAPTLVQDGTSGLTGAIAAAWLNGLEVRAGQRMLLGYVVGPSGSAGNLKVFAMSAGLLDSHQEVGLELSGATLVQQ